MSEITERHEGMCVPFAISFVTGLPIKEVIQKLAKANPTGRAKLGWSPNLYLPVCKSLGVIYDNPISPKSANLRIKDIFRFDSKLRKGTYFLRVTGHLCVLHEGKIYHNQMPTGENPWETKHNYRVNEIIAIMSEVKAFIPYEKKEVVPTQSDLITITNLTCRMMSNGNKFVAAVLGGRIICFETKRINHILNLNVNGRHQRSASGKVSVAISQMLKYAWSETNLIDKNLAA